MFCPNCGRDCNDFKFCPDCGRALQENVGEQDFEKRRQALEASGQAYCPKCLSTSIGISKQSREYRYPTIVRSAAGAVIDFLASIMHSAHESEYGDKCVCMNCGNEWYTKRIGLEKRHQIHTARFLKEQTVCDFPGAGRSYLQIGEFHIVISLSDKQGCIIPYDQLAVVDHREGAGPFYGRLTVRDRTHRHKPFPKTLEAAKKDRFTILYESKDLDSYKKIYSFLNKIIEENKNAGIL